MAFERCQCPPTRARKISSTFQVALLRLACKDRNLMLGAGLASIRRGSRTVDHVKSGVLIIDTKDTVRMIKRGADFEHET